MRLIDGDDLYRKVVGYNGGAVDKTVAKRLIEQQPTVDAVSRQAAIDAIDALCDRECEYSKKQRSLMCGACHLGSAFDVIEQLPSAQPENMCVNLDIQKIATHKSDFSDLDELPSAQPEIIRCKDCEHYLYPHGCGHIDGMTTAQKDGFCSYAERRTDG